MGTAAAIDQGSFGLSKSSLNSAAKGRQDTGCDTDYLQEYDFGCSHLVSAQQRPFRVIFKTDGDEDAIGISSATANEQGQLPGGIIGFHLNFALQDC
ncbi:hypothetical protein TCAL_16251 [Tigriopus californicus]|uniref:Uncharacterized protein n=1 Tax=Tigriopus californicus TaxID=6832 RepID=A0A553N955_TIGCA|nr:hypothetical protein TCAL_16251 [Tigriopus californicus]